MGPQIAEQYAQALKAGQKYYKAALSRGEYPYAPALDRILPAGDVAGTADLGILEIPAALIAGTRTAGRTDAFAGNFMPLLPPKSEFAAKWMNLCEAHLTEGIRDPVRCCEYMGRFYIAEGNKRVSVLLSYGAPSVPAQVTRLIPRWSDAPEVRRYYEFMEFYALAGLYGVELRQPGGYKKLQAALGFDPDHVWTEEERRSFTAGFARFTDAFRALAGERPPLTAAEALMVWLQFYPFGDVKVLPQAELQKKLAVLWPDAVALAEAAPIAVSTGPETREKGVLARLLTAEKKHLTAAFIYGFAPENSGWTLGHDCGARYLAEHMGERVTVKTYLAEDRDYAAAIEAAAADGAELIFATIPSMIAACRKAAALHPGLRILNCGLFQPYTGVRMYYPRLHECKFITGAIAGAMTETDTVGYVASYPIFGVPASVNAFALGVAATNPRARVELSWSCCPGHPVKTLLDRGADVISNRDAASPRHSFQLGTYKYRPDGSTVPLAAPLMYWGEIYERIALSVLDGSWASMSGSRAISYWWGMDSGSLDIQLAEDLPAGVAGLARFLKNGFISGDLDPFRLPLRDQSGVLRTGGPLTPEELMTMDWLCENVDGAIPGFEELLPMSRETVRQLGLYRDKLTPEKEAPQL